MPASPTPDLARRPTALAHPFDRSRAIDLLEIDALVTEFAYLIDNGRTEQVADLFVEGGWYGREGGARSVGHDAIRRAYALRAENSPDRVCRHLFSNLRIEFLDDDRATGCSTLTLFAGNGAPPLPADVALVQDYRDAFLRVGDRWLFQSRETRRLFADRRFRDVLALGNAT